MKRNTSHVRRCIEARTHSLEGRQRKHTRRIFGAPEDLSESIIPVIRNTYISVIIASEAPRRLEPLVLPTVQREPLPTYLFLPRADIPICLCELCRLSVFAPYVEHLEPIQEAASRCPSGQDGMYTRPGARSNRTSRVRGILAAYVGKVRQASLGRHHTAGRSESRGERRIAHA